MAPSPEYDKEPKAPDKSATHISSEDTKHNIENDTFISSPDNKPNDSAANSEAENPPHVSSLDECNLQALLEEAITYKNPKDRINKSSLFKELLNEVEQDEAEACEAAARNLTGCRGGSRRVGRGRKALPNSNSLQDLVAALAAEPLPKRHAKPHHHQPTATVSAKTKYGGSLPSGVDTSSLLVEEGGRAVPALAAGAGSSYLATVRCVNPPPLAERRVSTSDANPPAPHELEPLNRRSKPAFPVTYTARATLEIGSGSVCSGRAVTTTTASNQVRTTRPRPRPHPSTLHPSLAPAAGRRARSLTHGTPETIYSRLYDHLTPGGGTARPGKTEPRGPNYLQTKHEHIPNDWDTRDSQMARNVDDWYRGLSAYARPRDLACDPLTPSAGEEYARSHSAPIDEHPRFDTEHGCEINERDSRHPGYYVGEDGNLYRDRSKFSDKYEGDISLRKRGLIGSVTPAQSMNPRNVKSMTIGKPLDHYKLTRESTDAEQTHDKTKADKVANDACENVSKKDEVLIEMGETATEEDQTSKCFQMHSAHEPAAGAAVELAEMSGGARDYRHNASSSFTEYLANQQRLLRSLQPPADDHYHKRYDNNNTIQKYNERDVSSDTELTGIETIDLDAESENSLVARSQDDKAERYVLAELPNNAYIFLTLPKRLLNKDRELHDSEPNNNKIEGKKRKKDKVPVGTSSSKRTDTINRNALRVLLFENLYKDRDGHGSSEHEVDSAIPFSCITSPEVVASCNTTSSSSTALALDPKPVQLGSGYRAVASLTGGVATREWPARQTAPDDTDNGHDAPELQPRSSTSSSNGLPLVRPTGYGATASTNDEYKKTFDENGNAVQPPSTSSPVAASSSSSSSQKKPRRKKSSKNETVIDCQQLDGYMGDKVDVNELLRFIESNAETRGPKMRAKHKDDSDDKATKKRSSERRKDKEKVKRASSLEELSRTKLEDLTARSAPAPKPERRSWGDATPSAPAPAVVSTLIPTSASEQPKPPTPLPEPEPEIESEPVEIAHTLPTVLPIIPAIPAFEYPVLPLPDPIVEQADFQTVTKKRKPRRRTDEPPRRTRQPSPRRQESAPPSDRSNDSNDDMDSVHSLPQPVIPPAVPHASYADIARTRHNIPDLIESCNYYTEEQPTNGDVRRNDPIPTTVDSDGYPALETRIPEPPPPALPRRRDVNKQPPPPRRDRKERLAQPAPTSPTQDSPAPDVVADRRPPVILLDSNSKPRDMDGVTFGFDINEQLLGGVRRVRCDLVRDAVEPGGLCVRAACRALRYLPPPPPPPPHTDHLAQIIHYVATAWDDIIRCDAGKVRYYSE